MKRYFTEYTDSIFDFKEYKPFPLCSDRESWLGISADLKDYLLDLGKSTQDIIRKSGWPHIYMTDYLEFSRSGDRVKYENLFFGRRNYLEILVLAECLSKSGNYLDDIINGISLLCEESSWCLPAHNSRIRDHKQECMPDVDLPVVDLFACETSALLSLVYYLLKDELDSISPLICKRIKSEINRRIITPYLSYHFWWMGDEMEVMCNWTPWCTQNVLLTVFLTDCEIEVKSKVVKQSLYSLDSFLKDYGEDGCCSEGVEYYRHAGLCMFDACHILDVVSGGSFSSIYSLQKIRNMAEFVVNMRVDNEHRNDKDRNDGYYYNFADCSPKAGFCGVREYLFGKNTKSTALMNLAAKDWKSSSVQEKLFGLSATQKNGCSLYYILQSLFYGKELDLYKISDYRAESRKFVYYPSTGVWITRTETYNLAVKAGGNGDSHNHNDTGSIILYKNGKPFLIDLGVESYTAKTFSSHRYEIWTMQSAFHNLPLINDKMQCDGKEYKAGNVIVTEDSISMDIAGAYPADSGCSSYVRTVKCSPEGILLEDKCESGHCILSLMTQERPEIISAQRIKIGDLGYIEIQSALTGDVKVESYAVTDARLQRAWHGNIYRILLDYDDGIKLFLL